MASPPSPLAPGCAGSAICVPPVTGRLSIPLIPDLAPIGRGRETFSDTRRPTGSVYGSRCVLAKLCPRTGPARGRERSARHARTTNPTTGAETRARSGRASHIPRTCARQRRASTSVPRRCRSTRRCRRPVPLHPHLGAGRLPTGGIARSCSTASKTHRTDRSRARVAGTGARRHRAERDPFPPGSDRSNLPG